MWASNPLNFPSNEMRRMRRKGYLHLYVYPDGTLNLEPLTLAGTMFVSSSIDVLPNDGQLRLNWLDPCSVLFEIAVNDLRPYYPDIDSWDLQVGSLAHPIHAKWHLPGKYYRTVGFWLRQPRCDLSLDQLPRFFYHGSCSELWYDNIKGEGLKPRNEEHMGSFGSYGASGALSYPDRVYLSVHPDMAARGAAFQAATAHGGWPTILQIDTKALDPAFLGEDEDIRVSDYLPVYNKLNLPLLHPALISMRYMGALSYRAAIPAQAIRPISRNTKIHQSEKGSWVVWDQPPRMIHPVTHQIRNEKTGFYFKKGEPVFLALYNAGVIDVEGNVVDKNISDQEVRKILKNSPWAITAVKLMKDINEWGRDNIKSLDYYPTQVLESSLQQVIDLLVKHRIYFVQRSKGWVDPLSPTENHIEYLTRNTSFSGMNLDDIIGLAMDMHVIGLTYPQLLKMIFEIRDRYRPT